MNYLKLIQYQNIVFLIFLQLVFRYFFLANAYVDLALTDYNYSLLIFSSSCIAAGGAVILQIMNQEVDAIKKPQNRVVGSSIAETVAYNWYIGFTTVGVGIGFYLSNIINKPTFAALFILVATLHYVYATNLKQIPFIGTGIAALFLPITIVTIALFDLLPAIDYENYIKMKEAFGILMDYAVFAFLINLIRELIVDLENKDDDYQTGARSLSHVIGIPKTKLIIGLLTVTTVVLVAYYLKTSLFKLDFTLYYALVLIFGPLVYFGVKLLPANDKKEFHHLGKVLTIVLFFGMLSIAVIILNFKYAS